MKLSLIGYGKTGIVINTIASERNHQIVNIINSKKTLKEFNLNDTICIDFTSPTAFRKHYKYIAQTCKAAVIGTTGWNDIEEEVINYFSKYDKTLIYSSNFAFGTNIFFEIVNIASKLISHTTEYDPYILEMHHKEKKDNPSGTAKVICSIIQDIFSKKITPSSIRSGWIRGIHEVGYESKVDKISIKHEIYTRKGFAYGAVIAAEWSNDINGIWNFRDLWREKFKKLLNEKY